jgi:copper homeostasis protein
MTKILREFCAENFTDIPRVVAGGVDRIELCDNLAVGGTTPSFGVIKASAQEIAKVARETGGTPTVLAVMIRPRGGDFAYNAAELEIMAWDIDMAKQAGADALVFGVLNADGTLNMPAMQALIERAGDTPVVCHMAFDATPDPDTALEQLVDLGVKLVLTHGARSGEPLGTERLKGLINRANGRIDLMVGGGITAENYVEHATAVGAHHAHGTKII